VVIRSATSVVGLLGRAHQLRVILVLLDLLVSAFFFSFLCMCFFWLGCVVASACLLYLVVTILLRPKSISKRGSRGRILYADQVATYRAPHTLFAVWASLVRRFFPLSFPFSFLFLFFPFTFFLFLFSI
jgi:hypothetical protein